LALLLTEYVWLCVIVVWMSGIGKKVVAILTLLVGYNGLVFVAVTFVGGTGCMGAYLVGPVCIVYSTSKSPASGAAATALAGLTAATVLSTALGPLVPSIVARAVFTAASHFPSMPE
jgi:hypothetical protein